MGTSSDKYTPINRIMGSVMAQNTDDQSAQASSAPKKRSLFNKPKRSAPAEADANLDLFSRSRELFPLRVAEAERKRQAKLQRPERKRSSSPSERDAPDIRDGKKTRLSADLEEGEHATDTSARDDVRQDDNSELKLDQEQASRPTSKQTSRQNTPRLPSSPPYGHVPTQQQLSSSPKEPSNNVISLSDSDSDDDIQISKKSIKPVEPEDDFRFEDEEFPELVLKARERERQMELDRAKPKEQQDSAKPKTQIVIDDLDDEFLGTLSPAPNTDPIVEILVSSFISNTKPLIVRRKLSQRLREVRLSWCDRQFVNGQPLGSEIFLTWKGKKLFDVTTCKSLGIKVNPRGILDSDGEGFDAEGRIHLEAWTEELYRSYQQGLTNREERLEEKNHDEPAEEKQEEHKIRIIMTPREMEPYKLIVKPTTTIGKMILAFTRARSVPNGKEVSIFLDGDRLDPESTVEDTDLEDLDTVEVHIK